LEGGTLTIVGQGEPGKEPHTKVQLFDAVSVTPGSGDTTPVKPPAATQPATQPEVAPPTPTLRPADAVPWHVTLVSGDRVTGFIDRWTKTTITFGMASA